MRVTRRIWFGILATLALVCNAGAGAAETASSFDIRVGTPELKLVPQDDGSVAVEIEGFEARDRHVGAPDIPRRTVLVAIPPGAEPRLEIRSTGATIRRVARPRPVPRTVASPSSVGEKGLAGYGAGPSALAGIERVERFEPDTEIYSRRQLYPSRLAWLGETGVLRDQRYVKLYLAPVRYDGATGGLDIQTDLEVTVHFDGAVGSLTTPRDEPRFEPVYRKAFVNYAQGRQFRMSGRPDARRTSADAARTVQETLEAAAPIRRIRIHENGVVRLDHDFLLAQAPEFLSTPPENWKLTSQGVQVPLQLDVSGGDDPSLMDQPGEWVQFYGQALIGEPFAVLNHDNGGVEDLFEARDFTDVNVYFLTLEESSQPLMVQSDATPPFGTTEPDFVDVAHVEVNDAFWPLADADPWYWEPVLVETPPANTRTESVPLPGLVSGTMPAQMRVHVRGTSDCENYEPDHMTRVSITNDLAQTLVLPPGNLDNVGNENLGTFDGHSLFLHDFAWSHSGTDPVLTDPIHVTLTADDIPGACPLGGPIRNDVYLDWIEVEYRRVFQAEGDKLDFQFPDVDAEFEISGFDSATAEVYEVTNMLPDSLVADAVRLTGVSLSQEGPNHTVRFRITDVGTGAPRRFVVTGEGAISTPSPSDFVADRVSEIKTDTTQADLIVITHPDLVNSSCSEGANPCATDNDCQAGTTDRCEIDPSSKLSQLLSRRLSQGITSRVVRMPDVEDEFNDGLPGPLGIESFLGWVMAGGWDGDPPSYVMLLGDGSYDSKGGIGAGDYVPTQIMYKYSDILGYYSSDNLLAAVVDGDQLPDLVTGRIGVRSAAEADNVLQKILDYEEMTPAGAWRANTVFISDRANDYQDFEAQEFDRINEIGEDFMQGTNYTAQHLRYWSDNCLEPPGSLETPDCDPEEMRQAIIDAVNGDSGSGAAVVQFTGHGNFFFWSSDVIFCSNEASIWCDQDDTLSLNNGLQLPWLIVHNCLSGGFHSSIPKTMGEQWLKREGGGSVAVLAPSGLGFRFLGEAVAQEIWEDLLGPTKERRVFVPVMNSLVRLCGQDSIEGCQFYTFQGDPSMTLALPHVEPPSEVVAVAGNAIVELSWTESATPQAEYNIYRTKQLTSPYVKLNGSPVAGPSYQDTTVSNAQTYYYYVVAVKDGFESAWSNFNTDCGPVPGDDCVQAAPLNLTPPVPPAQVVVVDPETGGRLDITWDANPEPDIDFYTVHYGLTPAYGQTMVASFAGTSLQGLENGTTYYLAVKATNTSGVTSEFSEQATGVPTLVLGIRPPRFIEDLRLARDGEDARLSWGAVTTDIYGAPTTVEHYEVYRGTTPDFVPSAANLIGEPPTNSFTDTLALAPGEPNYHYLVRAVDGLGNAGGLGRHLPYGVRELLLQKSGTTPGNLILSWSPVETDIYGNPTQISHYDLYGSDQVFSRADIVAGSVELLPPLGNTTTVEIGPEAQNRYYSVLAVDVRGNESPF